MEEKSNDEDIDWSHYGEIEEENQTVHLEGKDYVALFIASLQTIFLPLVVIAIMLVIIGFMLGFFL